MNNVKSPGAWRADIQALRGLAVLLVVADHAGVRAFTGGFLGVDIFFVISGFLMTGLIVDEIDAGRFTLSGFYARRVRRLLPAAYATIIVTAVLSALLLDPFELRSLASTMTGAFTFTTNIVLWRQVDYFDVDAALKPLLHMWSLAVEEQYYILVPMVLLACPRKARMGVSVVVSAISFVGCLYLLRRSPITAFYLLPPRAWELGIGSIAALVVRRYGMLTFGSSWLRAACAIALVVIPMIAGRAAHPGWTAALVCLLAAWLMVSGAGEPSARRLAPMAWVGDRSYSLYLVHWPVLALANNVYIDPVPPWVTVGLLVLVAAWTELQYRFVEQRLRRMALSWRRIVVLVAIPVLVLAAFLAWSNAVGAFAPSNREGNAGFSSACNVPGDYSPIAACRDRETPGTLVWGDSFAMHLAGGLAATSTDGLAQATRFVCGPFLDIAPMDRALQQEAWAEGCIRFNASVLDHLASHPEVHTVVLASMLRQYLPSAYDGDWRLLTRSSDGFKEVAQDPQVLAGSMANTVRALHAMGKRVVFIEPPPSANFDIGRCLSRADAGKPTVSSNDDCAIPVAAFHAARKPVRDFIAALRAAGTVPMLSFEPHLCNTATCTARVSGIALYSETNHFSVLGSRQLGKEMNWGRWMGEGAR